LKFAATILYEDSHAPGATRFGLHTVIVRLVADELNTEVFRVDKALDARPMKGIDRVLGALTTHAQLYATNGRLLIGCVDSDRLDETLKRMKLSADLKAASTLPKKVSLFALAHNTEAMVGTAASLIAADEVLRRRAVNKELLARETIFIQLSQDTTKRMEFRNRYDGVNKLVVHLAACVSAFLARPPT
jgi:hypothetical protein